MPNHAPPNRKQQPIDDCISIEEHLELFPIGYPVSEVEAIQACGCARYAPLLQVLKTHIDGGDWEYVYIGGMKLVQRMR